MATSQGGESTGATQWAETCSPQLQCPLAAGDARYSRWKTSSSQEEQLWQQRILFRSAPRGLPRAR